MINNTTPVFSVITVTWNAASVIEETILSVINQTYSNVEYIIVDGVSKDGTLKIIDKYVERIQKIVSEPDKGLYDAMNKGINLASGDYICFLNAGDTFHSEDTLQKAVESFVTKDTFQKNEYILPDVIYGETTIVNQQRKFLHMRRLSAPEKLSWKSFKMGMLVCHQAFWVKRELAEPYDLHYRFSADFDWCIRMLKKSAIIHNTHLTLIDYLAEGMTTQNHKASLKERFHIMVKYYGWLSTIFHHLWFICRLLIKSEKSK